jgi:Domain of unknown function (DUF4345)
MRKLLQALLGVFGVVVILISLLHLAFGPAAIPGAVPVNATMDSEDRFYAMPFLAFGATLIWCAKSVESKAAVVYFLMLTFFVGGVARLVSIALVGLPNNFFIAMLALELVLPFLLAYLQHRVSAHHLTGKVDKPFAP